MNLCLQIGGTEEMAEAKGSFKAQLETMMTNLKRGGECFNHREEHISGFIILYSTFLNINRASVCSQRIT